MKGDVRSTTPTAPAPASPVALQPALPASPDSAQPHQPHAEAEDRLEEHAATQSPEPRMEINAHQTRLPRPAHTRTPEPPASRPAPTDHRANDHAHAHAPERSSTPGTPSSLPQFDWDELESRFEKALGQANQNEQEVMAEFEALVKYFNIWASTASAHDNDRAIKRLQTRTQFVKLKEVDLASKKQNYTLDDRYVDGTASREAILRFTTTVHEIEHQTTSYMMPSQLSTQQKLHTPLPQLTETDLSLFHEAHFGDAAVSAFANEFMALKQANVHSSAVELDNDEHYYYDEEEDDGLGYYPDGVKRTLTDEQIALFRHSELQALERARERNPRRRNSSSPVPVPVEQGDSEDGEIIGQEFPHSFAGKKKKNKKKKRGSGNGNKRGEPVVDLRRRTWDIVEQGVDSLDYDEMEQANASTERVAQRRRITYDDSG